MRKFSYSAKPIAESFVSLALLMTPLLFLTPPFDSELGRGLGASAPASHTPPVALPSALGKFLESEISNRIERVSGRHYKSSIRTLRARAIASAVAEASYLYSVDPFLLLSMIEVESRYHADARGLHGEIGLMQIKPTTARWIAPITDPLYDCDLQQIRCNVMMGARYIGHIQHRVKKQRDGDDEIMAKGLATAPLFREHVLRSYNLGPAKANRLAINRKPATEGDLMLYATKIASRSDGMRRRYLAAALGEVTPAVDRRSRVPESISTVAMTR